MYPQLPDPPLSLDGLEVLAFVIRSGVTVTCSSLQLSRALAAATVAGRYSKTESLAAVAAIRSAQDAIAATLRARASLAAVATVAPAVDVPAADDRPSGGSKVPAVPVPPKPVTPAVASPF